MSWSIGFIGTPEKISAALTAHSEKLDGQSKIEYDAALPHLDALVASNYNKSYPEMAIQITANGHAYNDGQGETSYSNCNVSINALNGQLV